MMSRYSERKRDRYHKSESLRNYTFISYIVNQPIYSFNIVAWFSEI